MNLDTPVRFIKGVGPAKAKLFNKLGVFTVRDLLEYYPREWEFAPNDIEERLVDVIKWKQFNRK